VFGINDRLRQWGEKNGSIRVAVVGAGSMGSPCIDQITTAPAMGVDVVVDLDLSRARQALLDAGIPESGIALCETVEQAEVAIAAGKVVCSGNPVIAWSLETVDCVVEVTGDPAAYADIAVQTIRAKKHLVTFNVEGDVLIGHVIKMLADAAGVVYTGIYGDEPGVVKALYDEADALGFEILAAGRHDYGGCDIKWNKDNIGSHLQSVSAKTVQNNLALYASFCDGSRTNAECCVIANATGLVPDIRGMHGPSTFYGEFQTKVPQLLDLKENGGILSRTGVVERIMQAEGPLAQPVWCFVVVRIKNEVQRVFMTTMSGMGTVLTDKAAPVGATPTNQDMTTGIFYTPYHFCAIQAPISIALAVVDRQATIAPKGAQRFADVMSLAKKDLAVGEIIDEIGGRCIAGRVDHALTVKQGGYLPFALGRGARLVRPVKAGTYVTYDDVDLSGVSPSLLQLRQLQDTLFPPAPIDQAS